MKFKAVLFDLDGTLIDSLQDLGNSMNSVLNRYNFPIHEIESYKYFVGDGVENLILRSLPKNNHQDRIIEKITFAYREEYGKRWYETTKPYPNIPELLNELKKYGIKIAVLSNKPDQTTKLVVETLLADWKFDAVCGAKSSIPQKPDPAAAIEISNLLELDPKEFLYLGDTDTDMKTANAAGMFPVGVLWGFRTAEELLKSGAEVLIKNPLELLDLFFTSKNLNDKFST
jgi:phosphoglycolate phosphatase